MNLNSINPGERAIISVSKFAKEAGISGVTAWRWRRAGWLKTVNIAGRPYLTGDALAQFLQRAQAGEFAKEPVTPKTRK